MKDKKHITFLIIHVLVTLLIISFFAFISFKLKPVPFTDFKYYWDSFGNLSIYNKGGLLMILYLPLKLLGLQAYFAAFLVNSFCFIILSRILWTKSKSYIQLIATSFLLLLGIWLAGYAPIVNSDIPSIVLYILAFSIFIKYLKEHNIAFFIIAIVVMTVALTIRSQPLIINIAFLLLSTFLYILNLFKTKNKIFFIKQFIIFMLLSILFSISTNSFLESKSQVPEQITIHKRLTIYTGLFDSSDQIAWCGGWTENAVTKCGNESSIPFKDVIINGFKKITPEKFSTTILCKWSRFLNFSDSATEWLEWHLGQEGEVSEKRMLFLTLLKYTEKIIGETLKYSSACLLFISLLRFNKFSKEEKAFLLIGILFVLIYFGIHTFLEIQPRYIIPPLLFLPFVNIYLLSGKLKT